MTTRLDVEISLPEYVARMPSHQHEIYYYKEYEELQEDEN